MSSKALADKLLELGFEIKGHSSSVDDETAESIRNALKKPIHSARGAKRVAGAGDDRQSVIRRKATVIRRQPAAVVEKTIGVEHEVDESSELLENKVAKSRPVPEPVKTQEPELRTQRQKIVGVSNKSIGLTICRDCGYEFDPKLRDNRIGYINQCGRCAKGKYQLKP